MNINDLRSEIDLLDEQIIVLLEKRMNVSKEIAKVKKLDNSPVFDMKRENEILQRIDTLADENKNEIKDVYMKIFEKSKEIQR